MMAAQLHARALVDIRASNELRVCVAGSSADFYTANALAFARYLGVSATVVRLARWDQQFENAAGVVEGYFSEGTSTYKPNNTLTRGQISAIVWRMQNYNS